MPNRNAVVADDDFLYEESHDALTFQHVQTLGLSTQTLEEFAQCVSQAQVGGLIGELRTQRFEFGLQARLTLAQLGHAPA